jgi:hypothetical protein
MEKSSGPIADFTQPRHVHEPDPFMSEPVSHAAAVRAPCDRLGRRRNCHRDEGRQSASLADRNIRRAPAEIKLGAATRRSSECHRLGCGATFPPGPERCELRGH